MQPLTIKSLKRSTINTIVLALVIGSQTACGSDSATPNNKNTNATNTNTPFITAKLIGNNEFTWEKEKTINLQVLDQDNNAVQPFECTSNDETRVSINDDCSNITVHRIGDSAFTVKDKNGLTTSVSVKGIPASSPLAVNSGGQANIHRIVTTAGNVLTWGSNFGHQLAIANTENIDYSQYPQKVLNSENGQPLSNIVQVAHSSETAYALNKNGQVYGWGRVNNSTPANLLDLKYPEMVFDKATNKPLQNIVQISTVDIGTGGLGVTDEGKVMRWGFNDAKYSMYVVDDTGAPLSNILSVSADYERAYAINKNGQVYTWDLDTNANVHPISLVKDKQGNPITNVTKVVAMSGNKLALTKSGNVYAWGDNKEGQLGDPSIAKTSAGINYANLVKLDNANLGNITDIAIKLYNSYALTKSGAIYAWGTNTNNALAQGPTSAQLINSEEPKLVLSTTGKGQLTNVVAITAAGQDGALALKSDGTLVSWGTNWHGILTQDNPKEVDNYPYPVVIRANSSTDLNIGNVNNYTKLK